MNQDDQLDSLQITIEQAEEAIAMADALKRLHKNKDFRSVIVDGYFKSEASRIVLLKADPEMQTPENQSDVNNIITSIGGLYGYFGKINALANMLVNQLANDEATREEILQEQLGEETIQ